MSKNHEEINKYYNYDSLNAVQRLVQTKILRGAKLTAKEIETLCTGFLTNAIYASVIEGDKNYEEAREKSFEIAAQIVIAQGEEIEEQLKKNDEAEVETETLQSDDHEQSQSNQSQPNTSQDVKKISGGTMAHIIKKISEMMAAMSPKERNAAAANFAALFSVLGISFDKMDETMPELAKEPMVVANIKDILEGTKGEKTFEDLIENHLNPKQQEAISKVLPEDLEAYRKEKFQQREDCLHI